MTTIWICWVLLLSEIGRCGKWMWRMHFYVENCMKLFIWVIHMGRNVLPTWSVSWRNLSTGLNKLLELGCIQKHTCLSGLHKVNLQDIWIVSIWYNSCKYYLVSIFSRLDCCNHSHDHWLDSKGNPIYTTVDPCIGHTEFSNSSLIFLHFQILEIIMKEKRGKGIKPGPFKWNTEIKAYLWDSPDSYKGDWVENVR